MYKQIFPRLGNSGPKEDDASGELAVRKLDRTETRAGKISLSNDRKRKRLMTQLQLSGISDPKLQLRGWLHEQ
jgi:hypothetical protein